MSKQIITLNDITDGAIGESALEQSIILNRNKFVPVFEFNRTSHFLNGQRTDYSVSGSPQYVTYYNGYLYVSTSSAGVLKIDPTTGSTVASGITGVSTLRNIYADGTGSIRVASLSDNKLYTLNAVTLATTASVSTGPLGGIAYTSQGAPNQLWACALNTPQILRIKSDGSSVNTGITLGGVTSPTVTDVTYDGVHLWAIFESSTDCNVRTIRASDGALSPTDTTGFNVSIGTAGADHPTSITFDGNNLWIVITVSGSPKLKKLDLAGNILGTITLGSTGKVTFDGTYIAITNTSSNQVQIVSPSQTTTIENSFPVASSPNGIISDGSYFWTANSSTITRLLV